MNLPERNRIRMAAGVLLLLPVLLAVRGVAAAPSSGTVRPLTVIWPATLCATEMPDELIRMFEEERGIPIRKINLCTGDADRLIRRGGETIDVLIGHDLEAEQKLVQDGYMVNLRPVMYSNYALVGPPSDPAGVRGMQDPVAALRRIARRRATFFSRGDKSGTHVLELAMWRRARLKPSGAWYVTTYAGTDATLELASRRRGYCIAHYVSFVQQQETLNLEVMVEGSDANGLVTTYEVLAANPQRFPDADYVNAMLFIGWLTAPRAQRYIAESGVAEFGRQVNFPMAVR